MLGRVVVPLLRPGGLQLQHRALAPILCAQRRLLAQDARPRRPLRDVGASESQSPSKSTKKEGSPSQYAHLQEEFQSSANAAENTAPRPEDVADNVMNTRRVVDAPNAASSKEQEQIDSFGETGANANTTPRSGQSEEPLPDLTRGIPSTLDAELDRIRSKQSGTGGLNITEEPAGSPQASGGGGGGDDGIPKTSYISSADRKRQKQFRYGYIFIFAGLGAGMMVLGRNWDTPEEERRHIEAPSGWNPTSFYRRFKARLADTLNFYNEPAFQKLLPDPDPDPLLQPPFTLVLSLEDLLVHSEWSREHGWRVAKRPGVDYFVRYLSQYYELVVWTSQPMMMAEPIIRKFDPFRILRWPLFREATLYQGGDHIKDLSYLNRDLSKILIIDTVPGHVKNQPENAIILPKWKGDPQDRTLVNLIPFLEYLAVMGLEDTRAVLKSFNGQDIPTEFARREQRMREKFEAKIAAERPKSNRLSLGSALGLSGAAEEKPKMLWDQVRERGQKQYEMFDKDIRENGAKWMAEMAAEEKKAQEEAVQNMKGSLTGFFGSK